MPKPTREIEVVNDRNVADDSVLDLPADDRLDSHPRRVVLWNASDGASRKVMRVVCTRASGPARVTWAVHEELGGTPDKQLPSKYRAATWWDPVRFTSKARWDLIQALVASLIAAVTALLTVMSALDTETGTSLFIAVGVFVLGLVLTAMKLRSNLEDIAS